MNNHRIVKALQTASTTRRVTIGQGVISQAPEIVRAVFNAAQVVLIADENTYHAAGKQLKDIFEAADIRIAGSLIFPGTPTLYADNRNVHLVKDFLGQHPGIPVAVGSGTINDLTKLASHMLERQYMVVATAASMDGYTSFGASITHDGFKMNDACDAPAAVIADLDVLAGAPPPMSAWGYADLMGKVTAGADWIIADELGVEPIDGVVWSMVQVPLLEWLADPDGVRRGDHKALTNLFEGLTISGLAMQTHKTSRPASGSEHQFSHLWEMQHIHTPAGGDVSHGTKVGIGSMASSALYSQFIQTDFSGLDVDALVDRWPGWPEVRERIIEAIPGAHMAEKALQECQAKYIDRETLHGRLMLFRERWPVIKDRLQTQLLPPDELRRRLQAAGAETDPARIGVPLAHLRRSYIQAQMIRRRYTIFDLAIETGVSSQCIEALFGHGGYWGVDAGA